jgi:uncharacterized protein YjbJ (UPF0337 family)
MTDQHAKGAVNKSIGRVEEELGKLTGDKKQQARGKSRQVQGIAQEGLADIKETIRRA